MFSLTNENNFWFMNDVYNLTRLIWQDNDALDSSNYFEARTWTPEWVSHQNSVMLMSDTRDSFNLNSLQRLYKNLNKD
jgi:hypothetical protein